jgi:hypothetical protein
MHPILLALAAHAAQVRTGPVTAGEGEAIIVVFIALVILAVGALVTSYRR